MVDVHVSFPVYSAGGRSLKNSLVHTATGGRISHGSGSNAHIRALDGINLSLRHGDRVGLIGHNGAGKTTLLRVLAGIYEPTSGSVYRVGRIASLFNVMAGMDPQATGYENILLRGLFLGMSRAQINDLRDDIAAFSELGDYLAMPVATYSSGMMLRLAFSISTATAADIILMDEWLTVGDASFVDKAKRRLDQMVARSGILILASHSSEMLQQTCDRLLWIDRGQIMAFDKVQPTLLAYQHHQEERVGASHDEREESRPVGQQGRAMLSAQEPSSRCPVSSETVVGRVLGMVGAINPSRMATAVRLLRNGEWSVLLRRLVQLVRSQRAAQSDLAVVEAGAEGDVFMQEEWPANRPLISVVIPCFNYGDFVAEAVDSVLAQTFDDVEIIVVEGGSTCQRSRETVAALKRPRTRVYLRETPHPVGDNRNFGIEHARGKYICCLDADDKLQPTYLEKAAFLLENHGYDVVSTAIHRFGDCSDTIGVLQAPELSNMLHANHIPTCAVFRRSRWEEAGGYRDTDKGEDYLYEDWDFWVRVCALGARVYNIQEPLFLYRSHGRGSLSNQPGLLPLRQQGERIAEANRDLVGSEALERSRMPRVRAIGPAIRPSICDPRSH